MEKTIINSSEQLFREVEIPVDCNKHHKKATIVANYVGTKWKELDHHKTYRLSGWKCSLAQNINNCRYSQCLDCPHEPEKYL